MPQRSRLQKDCAFPPFFVVADAKLQALRLRAQDDNHKNGRSKYLISCE
jgi:hypothetical protein